MNVLSEVKIFFHTDCIFNNVLNYIYNCEIFKSNKVFDIFPFTLSLATSWITWPPFFPFSLGLLAWLRWIVWEKVPIGTYAVPPEKIINLKKTFGLSDKENDIFWKIFFWKYFVKNLRGLVTLGGGGTGVVGCAVERRFLYGLFFFIIWAVQPVTLVQI